MRKQKKSKKLVYFFPRFAALRIPKNNIIAEKIASLECVHNNLVGINAKAKKMHKQKKIGINPNLKTSVTKLR